MIAGGRWVRPRPRYNRRVFSEITRGILWGLQRALFAAAAAAVVLTMFYVAFQFFDGWWSPLVLIVEVAVIVTVVFAVRWMRYPGLLHGKDLFDLLRMIVTATLAFSFGFVAHWIAAHFKLVEAMDIKKWPAKLGMAFKFGPGERARIKGVVTYVGGVVTVLDARVVNEPDNALDAQEQVGTVIYRVQSPSGTEVEVPERELVEL